LETISTTSYRNNMRAQVAGSKGTEWMVSSYNAWQQRSPLANEPKRDSSAILQLVSRMVPTETHVRNAMALSFRVIVLIIGIILIGKSR
jgi:hypothetical protein